MPQQRSSSAFAPQAPRRARSAGDRSAQGRRSGRPSEVWPSGSSCGRRVAQAVHLCNGVMSTMEHDGLRSNTSGRHGRGFRLPIAYRPKKRLPARRTEQAGRRGNGSGAGTSRKRLKGLEPSTFCMASSPNSASRVDFFPANKAFSGRVRRSTVCRVSSRFDGVLSTKRQPRDQAPHGGAGGARAATSLGPRIRRAQPGRPDPARPTVQSARRPSASGAMSPSAS
jgi:hypothetical protein